MEELTSELVKSLVAISERGCEDANADVVIVCGIVAVFCFVVGANLIAIAPSGAVIRDLLT